MRGIGTNVSHKIMSSFNFNILICKPFSQHPHKKFSLHFLKRDLLTSCLTESYYFVIRQNDNIKENFGGTKNKVISNDF